MGSISMSRIIPVGVGNECDKTGFGMFSTLGKYTTVITGIAKMHHEIYDPKKPPQNILDQEDDESSLSDSVTNKPLPP